MGLNLSGGKAGAKRPLKKPKSKGKSSRAVVEETLEQDDEVVLPSEDTMEQRAGDIPAVERVGAFEGGLVNPVLQNAVNAHWRRSTESDVFAQVLQDDLLVSGVFFGAIYVKSSFVKKTGGSALL